MSPPAPATMSRTRMKTYFIVASPACSARAAGGLLEVLAASRPHLLCSGGGKDLPHRGAPFRRAVHGHAEPVIGETRIERGRRPETRQPTQDDHAEERRDTAEENRELERDHDERRDRRDGLAAGDEAPLHGRPDGEEEARRRPGETADEREEPHGAHRTVALEDVLDLVHRHGRVPG